MRDLVGAEYWPPSTVFGLYWGAFAALLPDLRAEAAASNAELGLGFFALGAASLPAILATGWLVDRYGRPTTFTALALFAVAGVLPGLAQSPLVLIAAFALVGATAGSLDAVSNARVATVETDGSPLMQLAHALNAVGLVVGAVLTGAARAAGTEPLWPLAVIAAVTLMVAMVNRERGVAKSSQAGRPTASWRQLPFGSVVLLGVFFLMAQVIESSVDSWSAIHIEDTLGAHRGIGGLGPAIFAGALIFGRLVAQVLGAGVADRWLMAGGTFTTAVGLALVAAAPGAGVAIAGFAISGLGYSVVIPIIYRFAGQAGGTSHRGTAISAVATIGASGYMVGPALIGGIAEVAGLRFGFWVLVTTAAVLAGAAVLTGRRLFTGPD